ncbi:acyltransferase [Olivibacter sitiensis]|uniref:acyltransferase n=1 Tax=Olivibacter sitiensis TaxID=376470 RepID=UPI000407C588|nr:acyltransferase [Olivibacter sitiensis]
MFEKLIHTVKNNPNGKKWAHRLLIPKGDFKPRWWVLALLNSWFHQKGKDSRIRRSVRRDLFPFQPFSIGDNSLVEDFSVLNNAVGPLTIGNGTIIGLSNVIIGPVMIGNNVMLAQHVVISGINHGYEDITLSPSQQPLSVSKIEIGDDVWIGANSTIVAGVHIGKHSIVGAGSVVTKNVLPYTVVVGNPARAIKRWNEATQLWDRI